MTSSIFLNKQGVEDALDPLRTEIAGLEAVVFETTTDLGPRLRWATTGFHGTVEGGVGAVGTMLAGLVESVSSATDASVETDSTVRRRVEGTRIPK